MGLQCLDELIKTSQTAALNLLYPLQEAILARFPAQFPSSDVICG
jgi:hypothetical protein